MKEGYGGDNLPLTQSVIGDYSGYRCIIIRVKDPDVVVGSGSDLKILFQNHFKPELDLH